MKKWVLFAALLFVILTKWSIAGKPQSRPRIRSFEEEPIMATGDRSIWVSNSDTRFDHAPNWSNGIPGSLGAYDPNPYFGGPLGGQASCLQNVSNGGTKMQVFVEENYGGDLGTLADPFTWWSDHFINHVFRGSGRAYINTGVGGAASLAIITVDSNNLVDAVTLVGCGTGYISVKRGHFVCDAASDFGMLQLFGPLAYATIPEYSSSNTVEWIGNNGGILNWGRTIPSTGVLTSIGGYLNFTGAMATNSELEVSGGRALIAPSAAISTGVMRLFDGLIDLSGSAYKIAPTQMVVGPDVELLDPQEYIDAANFVIDLRKVYP